MSDDDFGPFGSGFEEEEIDFQKDFRSEEEVTAPEYPPEGIYHASLQTVDCSGKSFPGVVFLTFEILAGNVDGQEGKILRYPIWPVSTEARNPEAAKKRWKKTVLRLMLALGLRKPGEFPTVHFNDEWWMSLEGKQCIVRVTHQLQSRTSESGKKNEWISAVIANRNDFFTIGDEAVKDIPIDKEAARIGGYLGVSSESI